MSGILARNTFRSVDEWKSALMTLPDNGFFDLLRSVFGNIKTPFNKQKLLDDLCNFLSRDGIQKTIAAYIDGQDHKLIAAVALLNEPAPGELETFFAGEFSFADLNALLLNLEERLILYRFRDEKVLRLSLNPALEAVLAPFAADTRPLFPSLEAEAKTPDSPPGSGGMSAAACVADGRILAALFAFFSGAVNPLRTEAGNGFSEIPFPGLRKKVLDDGKKVFPALDLELTARVFICLGLFRAEGRGLVPCGEKIADFGGLSAPERQEYWAAGLYLCRKEGGLPVQAGNQGAAAGNPEAAAEADTDNSGGGPLFHFSRNRLRRLVSFIRRFRNLLESGKRYPELTLRRFKELLEREGAGTENVWGEPLFDSRFRISFDAFLALMENTGLLEKTGAEAAWIFREPETKASGGVGTDPVIAMDTAFSFVLYPEISLADALALGSFCSVKIPAADRQPEGSAVSFELTRASVVRGFDQGMGAAAMLELLNRLSGNRLDANLGFTLTEWESRYDGVSLHEGIILCLAEDRRYLAEARPVASLIQKTLAPGVYLLSSQDRSQAAAALEKAGIDIIAQPPSGAELGGGRGGLFRNSFFRRESFPAFSFPASGGKIGKNAAPAAGADGDAAASIKQKFRLVLEKMRLTKQERDELSARIERRLVLTEAQLEGASLRYEKLEARGIDYAGKTAIAKQAIAAASLLEVTWPGPGGKARRITGLPRALEKKEGDSILVLDAGAGEEDEPEDTDNGGRKGKPAAGGNGVRIPGNTVRIPLGKISLLRRIKQSIFGE